MGYVVSDASEPDASVAVPKEITLPSALRSESVRDVTSRSLEAVKAARVSSGGLEPGGALAIAEPADDVTA